jgi:hypothetical protein
MHIAELNQTANELWQLGIIDMTFGDEGYDKVGFTHQNYEKYREHKNSLTDEQLNFLEIIVSSNLLGELDKLYNFNQ